MRRAVGDMGAPRQCPGVVSTLTSTNIAGNGRSQCETMMEMGVPRAWALLTEPSAVMERRGIHQETTQPGVGHSQTVLPRRKWLEQGREMERAAREVRMPPSFPPTTVFLSSTRRDLGGETPIGQKPPQWLLTCCAFIDKENERTVGHRRLGSGVSAILTWFQSLLSPFPFPFPYCRGHRRPRVYLF